VGFNVVEMLLLVRYYCVNSLLYCFSFIICLSHCPRRLHTCMYQSLKNIQFFHLTHISSQQQHLTSPSFLLFFFLLFSLHFSSLLFTSLFSCHISTFSGKKIEENANERDVLACLRFYSLNFQLTWEGKRNFLAANVEKKKNKLNVVEFADGYEMRKRKKVSRKERKENRREMFAVLHWLSESVNWTESKAFWCKLKIEKYEIANTNDTLPFGVAKCNSSFLLN